MSKRTVQHTIQRYMKEAGIMNASVHTLRHKMVTHQVARRTDLRTIQETLDHASLETAARYISLAKLAQKKALQEQAL